MTITHLWKKVFRNALHPHIQSKIIIDQHPRKFKDLVYLSNEVEQNLKIKPISINSLYDELHDKPINNNKHLNALATTENPPLPQSQYPVQ